MKKIKFMDCSFRDGFQSCLGARVKTEDFLPALEAAVKAGINHIEIGGGARFQALYFYCQEDAFEMMDLWRKTVGPDVNLQTLARGVNVVGLSSQSSDIIDLHAKLFKKHGITTIRNFDALNDVRNLDVSGRAIAKHGLKHQITVTMMGLAPNLKEAYAHTPKFYTDRLQEILDSGIPFDSLAFKDASGTSTPQTVYDTIKQARAMLGSDKEIQFHTHDTAGMAVSCNMAAIEAGADVIDLAMSPLSGGTCEADILVMYQRLRGTEYTLDIDPEKILEVEKIFEKCMDKYFMPPESMQVSPKIIFSPMPGGALTANTQMMRDNNCLDKYDACIDEMREVVAKGGFGTSVTPVSQFYFQQAFRNAVQGKNADGSWKMDPKGYGKMVLGYFGKTPVPPDPTVVKWAQEQLGLEPTTKSVVEINDANPQLGVKYNTELLEKAGLPVTDENIFIVAACGDKGLNFLKGDRPMGIRYKEAAPAKKADAKGGAYTATIDGKAVAVQLNAAGDAYTATVNGKSFTVKVAEGAAAPAAAAAPAGNGALTPLAAPLPGTVVKVVAEVGTEVAEGDVVLVIEAMKMETEIKAAKAGIVREINVSASQVVAAGDTLAMIEEK
ncbi:biotin/lipoyl-containing protein [Victivallis vadensis]|uniref:Biotin attachment protein n=1 Tax=Victivallis vadensis TaxID=172901 RepID=A0A2U1B9W0_9BACT|nr:biotin/lipoyl-containing protein [Victivallis vadensis]NMD87905.1 biotin attachment protein [Victivallis vadensis]PVY45443.1 pyruvate carboxylase subunit B [Victivallis vadensis]HJH02821.1 biotin/lipoyl-binding protein [Victivallis vadensis]